MLAAAVAYVAAINLWAFAAFAVDKGRAGRRGRRIPERTLLGLAALGGVWGALAGQQALRHKTRKQPFRTWLWLIAAAHGLTICVLIWRWAQPGGPP